MDFSDGPCVEPKSVQAELNSVNGELYAVFYTNVSLKQFLHQMMSDFYTWDVFNFQFIHLGAKHHDSHHDSLCLSLVPIFFLTVQLIFINGIFLDEFVRTLMVELVFVGICNCSCVQQSSIFFGLL